MKEACLLFAQNHSSVMVEQNLQQNFLLHLVSMHDFNLITTHTIDQAMSRLRLLHTQTLHRDDEDEEGWETAVESPPDPDLDPDVSEFKTCAEESSGNNQPEEQTEADSQQKLFSSVLK